MHTTHKRPARVAGALAAALLVALTAACGTEDTAGGPAEGADTGTVTVADAWVKAADTGMTGAFADLVNGTDEEVTVVSATTDAAAMVELHEVVEDDSGTLVMQEKDGGFVIPAGETYTLEPGADHIMLMQLTGPLAPGDTITVTLELDNGDTVEFEAAVKEFSGAQETYSPDDDHDSGHGEDDGHSMSPSPSSDE